MRNMLLLFCVGFCGCDAALPRATSTITTSFNAVEEPAPPRLHTDAFAVNLMKVIGMKDDDDNGYCVADDEVQTAQSIFRKFGIDPNQLHDFRHGRFNNSQWIIWKLSPSYEIVIDISDFDKTAKLPKQDPNRQVYALVVRRIEK